MYFTFTLREWSRDEHFFYQLEKKNESENLMNYINAENFKELTEEFFFNEFLKFGGFPSLRHVNSPGLRLFLSLFEYLCLQQHSSDTKN